MKVIITENKYDQAILEFIKSNYYPDYGWVSHKDYEDEVKKYHGVSFFINDGGAYEYDTDTGEKLLRVFGIITDTLNNFFHNKWVPIFKKWFEENTGLEVDALIMYHSDRDAPTKRYEF